MTERSKKSSSATRESNLALQLGVITFSRTVNYTGLRMVFPFLPLLARGMGVTLETAALALTIRSLMGLLSPVLGAVGDVRGRKWAQRMGLTLLALGMLIPGLLATYPAFLLGSLFFGLGIVIFDPAIQAYVGDSVPYRRRATAMAVVEMGWSIAFLIGIPVVGRVISEENWNLPFLGVAGLILLSLILVQWVLPESVGAVGKRPDLKAGLRIAVRHRPSMAAILVSFLMVLGSRGLMVIYGAWLEEVFQMTARILGDVSSAIGVAGILGLILVGVLTDRLGKKLSLGLGLGISLLAALGLPFLKSTLSLTVGALFVYYLAFEFALVTGLSLVSELRPAARATLMAFNAAAVSGGDALGTFLGPRLFNGSIAPNVTALVILNAAALLVLVLFVRDDARG